MKNSNREIKLTQPTVNGVSLPQTPKAEVVNESFNLTANTLPRQKDDKKTAKLGNSATKAKNKYRDKTYDRKDLILPKGMKDIIDAHAKKRGVSMNAYIINAIVEKMEQEDD